MSSASFRAQAGAALAAVRHALTQWHTDTRLYTLESPAATSPLAAELLVESFALVEDLSQPFTLQISCLTLDVHVQLKQLYARPITLVTRLADGGETRRSGYVMEAIAQESDGGFARKGLIVRPWIALLQHTLNSWSWQDKTTIEIVEEVLGDHRAVAAWRWDADVPAHIARGMFAPQGGQRPYCNQYRESDFDFIQRLLAEEGIGWRVEEDAQAPGGHTVVFFVNSHAQPADATSAAGGGIRFHRGDSQEAQDAIQALGATRQIGPTATVALGWDFMANRAIAADVPTHHAWGGPEAMSLQGWLHSYDPTGHLDLGGPAGAQFMATLLQEAREARLKTWLGRGTVRTLRAGTWAAITGSTLDALSDLGHTPDSREFFVTHVHAVGINNLPKELNARIAERLGVDLRQALDELAQEISQSSPPGADLDLQGLIEQARASGFAQQFQAIRRNVPWRPVLMDDTGLRPRPRPTAKGPQTAIVVGPDGRATPQGPDEIYTDALGRVLIRFHWQANPYALQRTDTQRSCWVRVVQPLAGAGMGHQFIPRIGQEVLVSFLGNDMDRPVVLRSVYNGRGESGVPHTPGGRAAAQDRSALALSDDHRPSSQMNLVDSGSGGHSPAWHGGAPGAASEASEGQNNAAALSGFKTKEFGGSGYNQLVFDDTPGQLRTQLHSTHAHTWLQMGHLLHQADNHRGSFRGLGFELRTDAWGGMRAVRGVMLSTFGLRNGLGQTAEAAGDNAAGIALARQMVQLAQTFHQAATTHQTVGLATAHGSIGPGQSTLDDSLAPAAALERSLKGMVSADSLPQAQADASERNTTTGQSKVPHMADPHIALTGRAGVGLTAGQDLHLSSGDTTSITSGQDTHWAVGGQMRVHTGQAIGMLAGAIQPGTEAAGKGLTMIAAQGAVDLQAQHGSAQVMARDQLEIKSANGEVLFQAQKRISMAVSGGASIHISGEGIEVACPGTLLVQASVKSMVGPGTLALKLPALPRSATAPRDIQIALNLHGASGEQAHALSHTPWQIVRTDHPSAVDRVLAQGLSSATGELQLTPAQLKRLAVASARWPNNIWLIAPGIERPLWSDQPSDLDKETSLQALAAMDFTQETAATPHDEDTRARTRGAAQDLDVPASHNFKRQVR